MKLRTVVYVHGEQESNIETFEQLCEQNGVLPNAKAISNSRYACYEVALMVEFDTETGDSKVVGIELEE